MRKAATTSYVPPTASTTTTSEPVPPSTSPSFINSVTNFIRNLHKAKGLREPRKYEDYNREAKDLFVTDAGEGFTVQLNKIIGQTAQHEFGLSHSVFVGGSGMRPPDYTTTVSFANKTTNLLSQIQLPHYIHFFMLKRKFLNEKLTTEVNYANANNNLIAKADYSDKDYVIDAQYDLEKGKIQISYMQSVLPFLQLGCSGFYRTSDRVSGLSTCMRYQPTKEAVVTAEAKVSGPLSQANTYNLKASYYQQVGVDTFLCTEATYDVSERTLNFIYGFQQMFQQAKFRVTASQDFNIKASFDIMPTMSTNINTSIDANPAKSEYKFGVAIQIN
ncbi:hypothetical protein FDP41_008500 [Naegleria fowleri]|uniref:Uncharacterized protein n=1 Tax=Naegleria fowleri TaxID=5763 RepID=A0A6A5B2B2_NAEFO|nr:uncharacterized protein FDP41_008500 [Naegleria fowleri]KAF0973293.1 hypothetical protein FDP41_008500 [Naegleria fowleri]